MEFLGSLKFQSKTRSWENVRSLVVSDPSSGDNLDEGLRASFAPDTCVLSDAYDVLGMEFFRL